MRRLLRRTTTLALGCALVVALSGCSIALPSWVFTTVDNGTTAPTAASVGTTSTTVIFAGQAHTFYSDSNGALRHAWLDGFTWRYERPFPGSSAGTAPSAIVFGGKLHLFYTDAGSSTLFHRVYTPGIGWSTEQTLDGAGAHQPTTAIEYGQLHVFYGSNDQLKHVYSANGTTFFSEVLDGNSALGGRTTDHVANGGVTTVSYFGLHLFYSDDTAHTLRHAWYANGWHYQSLDGDAATGQGGNAGTSPSATLYDGGIHVFYGSNSGGNSSVRHAWYTGSWRFEYLDGPSAAGAGHAAATALVPGSALLWNGQISLFYGNGPSPGAATLRHTYFVPGDGWHFEDFAARDFTASTISPTVVNGRPWVVFSDAGPDLTYGVYR